MVVALDVPAFLAAALLLLAFLLALLWPRSSAVTKADLQEITDAQREMLGEMADEIQKMLDHAEWRLDSFMRAFEEHTGYVCDATWGPPPLISRGTPLDIPPPPPPQADPLAAEDHADLAAMDLTEEGFPRDPGAPPRPQDPDEA